MRIRVPIKFAEVEARSEIYQSLKTKCEDEAKARFVLKKRALVNDWEARLSRGGGGTKPDAFDAALSLLENMNISYRPMDELITGPINELLARIDAAAEFGPESAAFPAALGALKFPKTLISEMPSIIEEQKKAEISSKNKRQLRVWRNKYLQAATSFVEIVKEKSVPDISEHDALIYRKYWKGRRDRGEITTNYVNKKLRFMRQLVNAYYERFDVPPSQRNNPFTGSSIETLNVELTTGDRKLAFPMPWVQKVLIEQEGLDGLNSQARDIASISAECGGRQSEIFDVPPSDIYLNHPIPHIQLQIVLDPEFKRELKNAASKRPVVLLGVALEVMKRHPNGFSRYRGKDGYSAAVNKYMRQNNLFPPTPDGQTGKYTMSCTRHTFEDRMVYAKMTNEERAYLMGHSIGNIRGRPVYGSTPDLKMRALYQEMVSFPTDRWQPRPIAELREEIDRLATELGFRVT